MIDLLILAALVIGYGLVSGWLAGTSVTAPMVFVTAGLVLGESGLGWLTGTTDEGAVRILAEPTLVLVLYRRGADSDRHIAPRVPVSRSSAGRWHATWGRLRRRRGFAVVR